MKQQVVVLNVNTLCMFWITRYKRTLTTVAVIVIVIGVSIAFFKGNRETPIEEKLSAEEELSLRPDMSVTIPILLDEENPSAIYDWALVGTETEPEKLLVETSGFDLPLQSYEFVLESSKANPNDENYTIPNYLALTLAITTDGVTNVIVYIDIAADGKLDSVFLNDVSIDNEEGLAEAQGQYTTELLFARDYMLDGVSI